MRDQIKVFEQVKSDFEWISFTFSMSASIFSEAKTRLDKSADWKIKSPDCFLRSESAADIVSSLIIFPRIDEPRELRVLSLGKDDMIPTIIRITSHFLT